MKKLLLALLVFQLVGCGEAKNKSRVADGPHKFERAVCTHKGEPLDKKCYREMLEATKASDNAVNDSLNRGRELDCTNAYGKVDRRCMSDSKEIDDAVSREK